MADETDTKTSKSAGASKRTAAKSDSDRHATDDNPTDSSTDNATDNATDNGDNPPRKAEHRPRALDVIRTAGAEFAELTGLRAESVTRFERTDSGWLIEAEVTELARVPDTMSLMASYEVITDASGRIDGYRRVRRYERGRSDGR